MGKSSAAPHIFTYFFLIPIIFTLFSFRPLVVRSANVYCYIGGGTGATNGSTLNFHNICVGNGSCFLTINADRSWRSDCTAPSSYSSNMANGSETHCMSSTSPAFCRCATNFCNTPNNQAFLNALNSTLSNIVKPADQGNLTCFECGAPYVRNADGTRSFAPFNVSCDGSKFCTGKYCVTRKSRFPSSYCATSWEDPKLVQCVGVSEGVDTQECICNQSYCNYPYDALNPPPETTTTTTMAPTTTTTTMATTTSPPSPWQCVMGCTIGQLTLTPGANGSSTPTVSNSTQPSPPGCAQIVTSCQSSSPLSVIAFGNQGRLRAFQPNFTRVDALLYCVRNNGSMTWTRFGTSDDPNAMIPVTQVRCEMAPFVSPNGSGPTNGTVLPPTPIVGATNGSALGPWQCVSGCRANLISVRASSNPMASFGNGVFSGPAGCDKLMVTCNGTAPVMSVNMRRAASSNETNALRAFQPNFTRVDSLLYCLNNNGSLMWTRFGTTDDPNSMVQPVTEVECALVQAPTTTPAPTTAPATTAAATTMAPTTAPATTAPATTAPPTTAPATTVAATTPAATTKPATTAAPAATMPATTAPPTTAPATTAPVTTAPATTAPATTAPATTAPPTTAPATTAAATTPAATTAPATTASATTAPATTPAATTAPATTASATTAPATTPAATTKPATTAAPAATAPVTTAAATQPPTTASSVPPFGFQCTTGCLATTVTLTPGQDTPTIGSGTFDAPAGCTKLMVTCQAPSPLAVVAFGTMGNLSAFAAPYNKTDALLYCIQNGTSRLWTRFGTTENPNALLQPVTEAHCMRASCTPTLCPNTPATTPIATTQPATTAAATTAPATTAPATTQAATTKPATTAAPAATAPLTTAPATTAPATTAPATMAPATTAPPTTAPATTASATTTPATTAPATTPAATTKPATTAVPATTAPATTAPPTTAPATTAPPTTAPATTAPPTTAPATTAPPTTASATTAPPTTAPATTALATTAAPAATAPATMAPPTTAPATTAAATTVAATTKPATLPPNVVVTCPDGRQFGPNDLAVKMGEILKQAVLNNTIAPNDPALDNFKQGIETHICNYKSGPGNGSGKRRKKK